jgi:hypothetical protein
MHGENLACNITANRVIPQELASNSRLLLRPPRHAQLWPHRHELPATLARNCDDSSRSRAVSRRSAQMLLPGIVRLPVYINLIQNLPNVRSRLCQFPSLAPLRAVLHFAGQGQDAVLGVEPDVFFVQPLGR